MFGGPSKLTNWQEKPLMLETPKASVVLPEALYVSKNVTAWEGGGGGWGGGSVTSSSWANRPVYLKRGKELELGSWGKMSATNSMTAWATHTHTHQKQKNKTNKKPHNKNYHHQNNQAPPRRDGEFQPKFCSFFLLSQSVPWKEMERQTSGCVNCWYPRYPQLWDFGKVVDSCFHFVFPRDWK